MQTPDPDHALNQRMLLNARRAFHDRIPVVSAAYSLDGRRFNFHTPVGSGFEPGRYVVIERRDGVVLMGQVLEVEIEQLESSEVQVEQPTESRFEVTGFTFGEARIRMRRHGLRGTGVLLGSVDGVGNGSETFDDAGISLATVEQVGALFDRSNGKRPMMNIGTVALHDGTLPGSIDPSGFNRHTFLCGQSGSGKTYSLGVVLEHLHLHTDLRIAILDPNADFVRLNALRDPHAEGGDEYLNRVRGMHVYRSGETGAGEHPMRIRFSDLTPDDQARALQLDPLKDREEFNSLRATISRLADQPYDLKDIQAASSQDLSTAARDVTLRMANLAVGDWTVWAKTGESSLADMIDVDWRTVVLDISRFTRSVERSVVALVALRTMWAKREQRNPVLIVVDEAHNICPAEPEDAIQKAVTDLLVTIAAEGRKYGLYLLISTQRPNKIHPNVLSQCDNLMLMRMNSQSDIDELSTVFSFVPAGMLNKASAFLQGEALFAGKIVPAPRLMRVGARLTQEGGADVPTTWVRNS